MLFENLLIDRFIFLYSVTLDLQRPAETGIKRIIWSFNLNTDIVTYYSNYKLKTEDEFKDKVYFNSRTFSLLVKNLRKSDSGIYRAEGPGGWVLAEYRLRVLEPVEAPVLTLVTYWSTGDSCHVTVNCTGGDRSLMSSCDNTSCSPEGGASTDSTLSMSVRDDIISCNHSNPFSWKSQTIEINRQELKIENFLILSEVIVTCDTQQHSTRCTQ
uniref:Immunoglobulin V-set domain-containing protein n=1 Tax=Denticeps clupeoides TaxID=299321 RepID=A0AAY4A4C0_9TELE